MPNRLNVSMVSNPTSGHLYTRIYSRIVWFCAPVAPTDDADQCGLFIWTGKCNERPTRVTLNSIKKFHLTNCIQFINTHRKTVKPGMHPCLKTHINNYYYNQCLKISAQFQCIPPSSNPAHNIRGVIRLKDQYATSHSS